MPDTGFKVPEANWSRRAASPLTGEPAGREDRSSERPRRRLGLACVPGSEGEYMWAGYGGTFFWIDPKEQLAVVYMAQTPGATTTRQYYRRMIKALVAQAIGPVVAP
jgi:CubicO group peptidase (beta-lactamase class C family)